MAIDEIFKIDGTTTLTHGDDNDLYCDLIITTEGCVEIPADIIAKHDASILLSAFNVQQDKHQSIARIMCKNYANACSCFDALKEFYKNR